MITSYSETSEGYYYVRAKDTARSVSGVVYGDQNQYSKLLKANPDAWERGDLIVVPGVAGRVDNVHKGETTTRVIQRMFPGQPVHLYQNRFYAWNGGSGRQFAGGEVVFVPHR